MGRASLDARRFAWLWFLAAASAAALVPFARPLLALAPACPLNELTGIPCLSCGSTRAAAALVEARPLEALSANPLSALGAMVFFAGGAAAPLWILAGAPAPARRFRMTSGVRWAVLAALAANWIYLLAAGV